MSGSLKSCESGDAVWSIWGEKGESQSQGCSNSNFSVAYQDLDYSAGKR